MDQYHIPRGMSSPVKQPVLQDVRSIGLKFIVLFSIRWFRRFCFLVTCSFSIIGYVYSTYGKMQINVHVSSVAALTDHVAYFLLTLTILMTGLMLLQFEKNQHYIFKIIRYISSKTTTKSIFGIISHIISAICAITFGLIMYFFMCCFGWDVYRYFVCRDIKFALLNLMLLSHGEAVYSIKCMFFEVNQELLSVYEDYLKHSSSSASNMDIFTIKPKGINQTKTIPLYKKSKGLSVLKNITKKHNELCSMMEDVSVLLGRAIFTSIISIVGNMLWAFTLLVEFKIHKAFMEAFPLGAEICGIASNVAWILTMTGQIVLIGVIGGALTAEGQNTSTYCYKLLDQLSLQKDDSDEAGLKVQLMLLAKQAETRCPVFSAWGFYSINLHILGMVASNMFAFAIVAIQFMLNEL